MTSNVVNNVKRKQQRTDSRLNWHDVNWNILESFYNFWCNTIYSFILYKNLSSCSKGISEFYFISVTFNPLGSGATWTANRRSTWYRSVRQGTSFLRWSVASSRSTTSPTPAFSTTALSVRRQYMLLRNDSAIVKAMFQQFRSRKQLNISWMQKRFVYPCFEFFRQTVLSHEQFAQLDGKFALCLTVRCRHWSFPNKC